MHRRAIVRLELAGLPGICGSSSLSFWKNIRLFIIMLVTETLTKLKIHTEVKFSA